MKFRRFVSGLLFGLGCAFSFLGLMAIVLPAIQNSQTQLILASFEMNSSHSAINAINHFMRFVLAYSWRVFYLGLLAAGSGAMLLLRFTPKPKAVEEPQMSEPVPEPLQTPASEKPNPYARVTYHQPPIEEKICWSFHQEPILRPNTIDIPEPEPTFEVQPYFSPRFDLESQAMETETGALSQSGSRILIRNMPECIPEPLEEPMPEFVLSKPEPVSSSDTPAVPTSRMTSPRIRSTMGRHTL